MLQLAVCCVHWHHSHVLSCAAFIALLNLWHSVSELTINYFMSCSHSDAFDLLLTHRHTLYFSCALSPPIGRLLPWYVVWERDGIDCCLFAALCIAVALLQAQCDSFHLCSCTTHNMIVACPPICVVYTETCHQIWSKVFKRILCERSRVMNCMLNT